MASVSNITLTHAAGPSANTRNVTVGGKMTFDAGDVGKTYRLEIAIYGEDKSGDTLPSGDAVGDDELYKFSWGTLFNKKYYKQVTVAAAGTQNFSETRAISDETLDEDPGKVKVGEADINTPVYMPRKDEVYAQASLGCAPSSARSTTVTMGVGV